jgi:hypothetical protein
MLNEKLKGNTKYKILNVKCPILNVEVNTIYHSQLCISLLHSAFNIRYSTFVFTFSFLCSSFLISHSK